MNFLWIISDLKIKRFRSFLSPFMREFWSYNFVCLLGVANLVSKQGGVKNNSSQILLTLPLGEK